MDITELQNELALYVESRRKILEGGQAVRIGETTVTRADLAIIEAKISELRTQIYRKSRGATVRVPLAFPY